MNFKRVAIIFAVISALLLADGLYMELSNYHPGDQNNFFGNGNIILSDGQVVLISAGFLIVATAVMWLVAARLEARSQAQRPEQPRGRSASKV
jgi:hypothetical protein